MHSGLLLFVHRPQYSYPAIFRHQGSCLCGNKWLWLYSATVTLNTIWSGAHWAWVWAGCMQAEGWGCQQWNIAKVGLHSQIIEENGDVYTIVKSEWTWKVTVMTGVWGQRHSTGVKCGANVFCWKLAYFHSLLYKTSHWQQPQRKLRWVEHTVKDGISDAQAVMHKNTLWYKRQQNRGSRYYRSGTPVNVGVRYWQNLMIWSQDRMASWADYLMLH